MFAGCNLFVRNLKFDFFSTMYIIEGSKVSLDSKELRDEGV